MYALTKFLDKPLLEKILADGWEWAQQDFAISDEEMQKALKRELISILYSYLERFNMSNDVIQVCKALLSMQDLEHIRLHNNYNYQKLLIILKMKPDEV